MVKIITKSWSPKLGKLENLFIKKKKKKNNNNNNNNKRKNLSLKWLIHARYGYQFGHFSSWSRDRAYSLYYVDKRFIIDDCLNLGVWDDQKFLGDWDAAFLPKRWRGCNLHLIKSCKPSLGEVNLQVLLYFRLHKGNTIVLTLVVRFLNLGIINCHIAFQFSIFLHESRLHFL